MADGHTCAIYLKDKDKRAENLGAKKGKIKDFWQYKKSKNREKRFMDF